ncbi:hypothetical protein HYX19_02460 [Candidatus Woesearchaeota archaeon]|nr:hypothetical protein [Candidatus Woesearchaeota archaeon]
MRLVSNGENNPLVEKVIREVDKLIDETHFDLESYIKLVEENHQATTMISNLWEKAREGGIEIIQPYLKQKESSGKAINEMISPIYDILICRGYTVKQLQQ